MDWSGVDYLWIIVMFLSAVFTLILTAPIHYEFNYNLGGLRVSTFFFSFFSKFSFLTELFF